MTDSASSVLSVSKYYILAFNGANFLGVIKFNLLYDNDISVDDAKGFTLFFNGITLFFKGITLFFDATTLF
jgi:hypothetical protein